MMMNFLSLLGLIFLVVLLSVSILVFFGVFYTTRDLKAALWSFLFVPSIIFTAFFIFIGVLFLGIALRISEPMYAFLDTVVEGDTSSYKNPAGARLILIMKKVFEEFRDMWGEISEAAEDVYDTHDHVIAKIHSFVRKILSELKGKEEE